MPFRCLFLCQEPIQCKCISQKSEVRILDFWERGQGRKTELVEACDFMGIKLKNSSWNQRITAVKTTDFTDFTDKEGIEVQGVFTRRVAAKEVLDHDKALSGQGPAS